MSTVEDINKSGETMQIDSSIKANDRLSVKEKIFYTWTLDDFSECFKFSAAIMRSPEFTFGDAKWKLWLQAVSKGGELNEIKIRVFKSEKGASDYCIKYKFSLLNSDGSLITKEGTRSFLRETVYGRRLSFMFHERKNDTLSLKNDRLTVLCELSILAPIDDNDPVSVPNVASDSKNEVTKSDNQVPETEIHKPLSPDIRILTCRKKRRMERVYFLRQRYYSILQGLLVLIGIFVLIEIIFESHSADKLPLNIREINELIFDSTLKIRNIAELLNLTDVKTKSLELLTLYRNAYNISDLDSLKVRVNFSEPVLSNYN